MGGGLYNPFICISFKLLLFAIHFALQVQDCLSYSIGCMSYLRSKIREEIYRVQEAIRCQHALALFTRTRSAWRSLEFIDDVWHDEGIQVVHRVGRSGWLVPRSGKTTVSRSTVGTTGTLRVEEHAFRCWRCGEPRRTESWIRKVLSSLQHPVEALGGFAQGGW